MRPDMEDEMVSFLNDTSSDIVAIFQCMVYP